MAQRRSPGLSAPGPGPPTGRPPSRRGDTRVYRRAPSLPERRAGSLLRDQPTSFPPHAEGPAGAYGVTRAGFLLRRGSTARKHHISSPFVSLRWWAGRLSRPLWTRLHGAGGADTGGGPWLNRFGSIPRGGTAGAHGSSACHMRRHLCPSCRSNGAHPPSLPGGGHRGSAPAATLTSPPSPPSYSLTAFPPFPAPHKGDLHTY